jgi:hypothetical protein
VERPEDASACVAHSLKLRRDCLQPNLNLSEMSESVVEGAEEIIFEHKEPLSVLDCSVYLIEEPLRRIDSALLAYIRERTFLHASNGIVDFGKARQNDNMSQRRGGCCRPEHRKAGIVITAHLHVGDNDVELFGSSALLD